MTTTRTYRVNAPHIVHEIFPDGEAALINLKSGAYYSLDRVGAEVWAHIDQRCSVGAIVERLLQRYDGGLVRIVDDVNTLIAHLQEEDLITPAHDETGSRPVSPAEATATKLPYSTPVLERFEDMKELLLLDPIHEVGDATGWPHAKSDEP